MQILKGTYKGFIDNEATNAEFKFKQLTIALDETKEKIGTALLPIVKELADYMLATVVPNIQAFAAGLTGEDGVVAGITDATQGAYEFGEQLISVIKFIISIKDQLLILGGIIAVVFVANKIAAFVASIQTLITAMIALRNAAAAAGIATAFATGGASVGTAAAALGVAAATYGLTQIAPSGNMSVPSYASSGSGSNFTYGAGNPSVNNITINALDSESAARAVAKVINESAARSGALLSGTSVKGN
jgi:20S proteasome alpha/beta subunit